MLLIAFATNYYTVKVSGTTDGISIFDEIFDNNIGWLFFIIIIGGYVTTIVFSSLDNFYSKRTKLSFQATIGFTALLFVFLVIWIVSNDDFLLGSESFMGVTVSGHLGFAIYWFIIHLITSGIIVWLYSGYKGNGEPSVYHCLLNNFDNKNHDARVKENLRKLKDLFDEGGLTEEEYLKEKQSIIDKI